MATKHYFQKLSPERHSKQTQSLPLVYTAQPDEGDEGGLDLGQLLAAVRRRGLVIAGVTTAVASAALAVALTSTPTYQAKFELLTEPVTVENKLTSSPLSKENESSVVDETELRILQSSKLMSPIVKQIEARYPGSGSPELSINPIKEANILEVSYQDSDPEKVQFVLDLVAKAYLKYSLEERQADIRQGIKFVEEQLPQLRQRVETLQEQLQKFRQRYNLIDPEGQGEQLSDQLNAIVQQRLDTQTQLAKNRSLYTTLQSELGLQPNEAVAASALSEAPRYQKLLNELQELESKIAVESARYRENSPTIQEMRAQQQNLLPLVEQEGQRVLLNKLPNAIVKSRDLASPNSIRLQQIQQFLDAANQIQALQAQNQALAQAESTLRQQFKQFPVLVRQNDDLERQLKIAVDNLNQFLTKREGLRIDAAQKQVPWQLLTPPTKPQPSPVSVKNNLILGAALGLLLGIGAALLVDKFKNVFYTSEEVKDTTRLPLLGEIPSQQHNVSQFWESLRSLYTNIRFLSFDAPVRSLAIVSAASEDGRSTIAVHLAQTAAAMGQRVLLVDADLRNPKIHIMLGLPNTKGLSNVIAEDLDFKNIIQRVRSTSMKAQDYGSWEAAPTEIEEFLLKENFIVLTAGQVPPNPTSLLSSQKMQNLARQFEAAFDLIVYDTSHFLGIADSSLLAAHTDASILVVGLGKTDRSALAKVLEQLKISSTPILGVVTNGIKG
jgi:uncharacterized protein involved in exopolysaccharide biosynthesis/Mrp family chromosome partitioning ATPase